MTDTAQPTPQTIAAKFLREIFEPDGERLTDGCIAIWSKASHLTQLAYTADDAPTLRLATGEAFPPGEGGGDDGDGGPAAPATGDAGLSPRQVRMVFVGLMLALLLAALEQMIVATALPKIVGELHGLDKMSWAITAYLLTSTVSLPVYGKLGDLFGRKGVFQFAIVVFIMGSGLAGWSRSMDEPIACRALQGLGAGGGAAASAVAYGAERLVTGFTDSIRDVERAKGELATLGVKDLDAVVSRGQDMQRKLAGITADAFVRAAYDIKSGISSLTDQGVADMTASAMTVAKATKGQAEQMTSLFATSYGIFKKQMADITDAEFGEQFGAALAASVQQFKTDGSAMQQAIESAGAGAVNLGMQMTEQLSLLGMMQQQMQAGEAGTALRAFATNAAKAHESFAKMKVTTERPVRVRILDDKGQLRAMPDILADLQARYGKTLDAFEAAEIKEAFGTDEAMKMINALYGQADAVRANVEALNDAAQKGAEFTEAMAGAADNNWDSTMILISQQLDVVRQQIGERLLPVVTRLTPIIGALFDKAFVWIDANPELVTGIGAVVVGIGALAAVMAPILLASSALISSWAVMSFGATRLALSVVGLGSGVGKAGKGLIWLGRTVLPLVGKAILFIGRALIANPIGLAIMAIAGAAYLIYQYWEPISEFFAGLWQRIKGVFSWAWDWIKHLFLNYHPVGLIYAHWDKITSYFSRLWERIKQGVSQGWEAIKYAFASYHPIGIVYTNWDGITEWFGALWDQVKVKFSEKWEAIKAEVATWPAQMKTFGAQMIQSLIDGIKGKFAALGQAIRDAMTYFNPFSGMGFNLGGGDAPPAPGAAPAWQSLRMGGRGALGNASISTVPIAVPDMETVAEASRAGISNKSVQFAPTYHMPISIEATGDPEALRDEIRDYLNEVKEQSEADARGVLHDE